MEYTRSSVIADGSNIVGVNTGRLLVGMYIYGGNYLPVGTTILSITDSTHLVMSNNSEYDATVNLTFSDLPSYKRLEMWQALHNVQEIVNNEGNFFEYILRDETDITRDDFNSIKSKDQTGRIILKAFPIKYSPSKEDLEKVGLIEDCDILIHTSTQDWIDKGYIYDDIEIIRSTIKFNGVTCKIKEKTLASYIGINGCYIVFSLKTMG